MGSILPCCFPCGKALQLTYGYSGDDDHEQVVEKLMVHERCLFEKGKKPGQVVRFRELMSLGMPDQAKLVAVRVGHYRPPDSVLADLLKPGSAKIDHTLHR